VVERREIQQWFIRITAYAEELLEGLDRLPDWPDSVKTMQRNWLGRSEGLQIRFDVPGHAPLEVFTTRPDTLFGVTYLAVAPEHPLARSAAEKQPDLAAFLDRCKRLQTAEAAMETMEKEGRPLGITARNPLSGEAIPVWVANFVLMGYGTGAVMAVPGHDQRDWEFARKYELPVKQVIEPMEGECCDLSTAAFTEHGRLVESAQYSDMDFNQAFAAMAETLESHGRGKRQVNWRLRDWGVSRQRYWGCPIPMIDCPQCGAVPVPENELPVVLPEKVQFTGVSSPLKDDADWRRARCPTCGGEAQREIDTFDTFVESSWYYARYCPPGARGMVDERANYWLPIDHYIGGIEHAVMHLLYFRFWHKLMRDAGLVDSDEPARRLLCQGMVVAETFYRQDGNTRHYYNPAEVDLQRDPKGQVVGATLKSDGRPVTVGAVEKMSKSKNNGVDPQGLVQDFGADTVRLFTLFASPPDQSLEWSEQGVEGARRFLNRLWRLVHAHVAAGPAPRLDVSALNDQQRALRHKIHATIAKVGHDVGQRLTFNTAIAAVMELLNAVQKHSAEDAQDRAVVAEALHHAVLLLAPMVPHISQALWEALGHESLLLDVAWPEPDPQALLCDTVTMVVQINGKLRARLELPADADRAAVERSALAHPDVQRHLAGANVRRVVVVPGKLVNVVVG